MEGSFLIHYQNIVFLLLGFLILLKTSQGVAINNGNCNYCNSSTDTNSSVCSSTGVTFPSKCNFLEAKCNADADWVIIYESECPESCTLDCSKEKTSKVCSTNSQTFNNRCEFEKQKCLQNTNWEIVFENECATLAPPPRQSCKSHQKKIRNEPVNETEARCLTETRKNKAQNGTLQLSDVEHCFEPRCDSDIHYHLYQCDLIHRKWCWCAKPDGTVIPKTFRKGLTREECKRRINMKCSYGDKLYNENQDFFPDTCVICTCLNGTVTCSHKYNTSILSNGQIEMLKSDLLQLFHSQYVDPREKSTILDTTKHQRRISDEVKRKLLKYKFEEYDRDNSLSISAIERHNINLEVFAYLHCIRFTSQVYSLIDSNQDNSINLKEWGEFFNVENLTRRKRSASSIPVRRKQKRRVQYVLS